MSKPHVRLSCEIARDRHCDGVIGRSAFAKNGLAVASVGDTLSRDSGLQQSNGDITVSASGTLDNTGGTIDGAGRGSLMAATIDNVRGQVLAGGVTDETALTVGTSVLNNQGGTLGNRDGDLALTSLP